MFKIKKMKKAIIHNKEGFKENCGFRNHIKRCYFKSKDCNERECDMYEISWDKKTIKKKIKEETKAIKKLDKEKKDESKTKKEKKEIENLIKDKANGIGILTEALYFLRFNRWIPFEKLKRIATDFIKENKK